MKRRRLAALAAAASLVLIAACGSDSDSTTTTGATSPSETAATTPPTDSAAAGGTEGTTADTTVEGTEPSGGGSGYTIDSSSCPDDASQPLADGDPIKTGITLTMTGPGSAPQLAQGVQAYFNQVNAEEGGVDGHELDVTVKDDAFDAARAVSNITEFIQSDHIFAVAAQQGSANILASQPVVEESCIPQYFVPAGAAQFADPDNHPWTSTALMAYNIEAGLWAKYLDEAFPDGAKVGMLVFNSEFGTAYVDALTQALEGTKHEIVKTATHEATAVNVDNEITSLIAAQPDIIIGATAGAACTQTMTAAATAGYDGQVLVSALCLGIDSFFKPAGDAADGVLMIQSFKDPADPAFADDAEVQKYITDVKQYGEDGTDPLNGFVSAGYRGAAALVESMRNAKASPEGLTRVGVADAVWNIDYTPPLAQAGVKFKMAGDADAYPVETGTMFSYDAASGSMVDTGLTLSAEGENGSYGG